MAQSLSTRPRCTIIIVGYNSAHHLARCLDQLVDRVPAACEIIVVDNASHDETVALLARWADRVRCLPLAENRGFAGGNNAGAALATGEFLVFLNPDTVPQPGWLDALLRPLEQDASIGMTTAQLVLSEQPHLINACGNDITWTGLTVCRGLHQPASAWAQPADVAAVSGAAFAIRRTLFEQVGGFDDAYFIYYEDTDLSLRVQLAGYRIVYVPEAVVGHQYRFKFSPQKAYYQERNRWLTMFKTLRLRTLLLLLPGLLLGEVMAWVYAALHGPAHVRAKMQSWQWLWRHRAAVRAKRREIAAWRRISDRQLVSHWSARLRFTGAVAGGPARWLEALAFVLLSAYGAFCRAALADQQLQTAIPKLNLREL